MLELYTYDAGKGDCLRIRFLGESGAYRNILIDSGTRRFGPSFAALLREIGSAGERVDVQFITHTDEDHLGGLLYMVNRGLPIQADTVVMNHPQSLPVADGGDTPLSVSQGNQVASELLAQKINLRSGRKGDQIDLDGARLCILHPEQEQIESSFDPTAQDTPLGITDDRGVPLEQLGEWPLIYRDTSLSNRASIIFVLEYGGKRLLFTGDAWSGGVVEGVRTYAGQRQEDLPVYFDAVKLPHHGSAGNISNEWPEALQGGQYILCADGRRHPSKQTVAKLLKWYGEAELVSPHDWWSSGYFSGAEIQQFISTKRLRLIQKEGDSILWQT